MKSFDENTLPLNSGTKSVTKFPIFVSLFRAFFDMQTTFILQMKANWLLHVRMYALDINL